MRMGGRPGAVISDHNAWNIGHATSESLAPSSQRRASVVSDGTEMGRLCFCESLRVLRTGPLALAI